MVFLRPAFASLALATYLAVGVTASVINQRRQVPEPWESLAGRSQDEIEEFIKRQGFAIVGAQPLPTPVADTAMKLVNTPDHQWQAPGPDDVRGPCPGMNTLANHGYYSRTGVDTPANLITGSQLGFNMAWDLSAFVTMYSHVLFGNPLTNLLSIGGHTPLTGPNPAGYPAPIGGLATPGDFEGDASQSRPDKYFGNQLMFSQSVFDQFLAACDQFDGFYNVTSASYMRYARYEDSKANNPEFNFKIPRYMTAYGETTFPMAFWQDGRAKSNGLPLNCRDMSSFYMYARYPDDFWRRDGAFGLFDVGPVVDAMRAIHQLEAGHNEGLGNWIPASGADQMILDSNGPCAIYRYACHKVTTVLYPNATGALRDAIQGNFANMYIPLSYLGIPEGCPQLFPYEEEC